MKTSGRPRSTRDRPAKAPLSEEAIVDAAVAILTAEGLEAVSMRRIAAALDTGAGSLYVYVEGRDGLLEAMFDRIIATVKLETPDPSRWRAQLHSLLGRLRAELVTHPGMAAATMVDPPRTEVVEVRLLENLLGILLAWRPRRSGRRVGGRHPRRPSDVRRHRGRACGAPTPAHWLPKSRPTSPPPASTLTTFRS